MNEKDGASCRGLWWASKESNSLFLLASVFVGFGRLKWNHGQERKEGTRSAGVVARWFRLRPPGGRVAGRNRRTVQPVGKERENGQSCDPVTQLADWKIIERGNELALSTASDPTAYLTAYLSIYLQLLLSARTFSPHQTEIETANE